jgi:hypothetical protein
MSTEEGWSDARFDAAVEQEFHAAMSRLYGRKLFRWAVAYLLERESKNALTEEEIACLSGVSQSTISRWKRKGALSLESLVTILTKLEQEVCDLPELPPLQERVAEGYRAALAWVRDKTLTMQDFLGFVCLWAELDWRQFVIRQERGLPNAEDRIGMLERLSSSVAGRLGKYLNRKVSAVRVEYLDMLDTEWRQAWRTCEKAIGYKWQMG